MTSTARPIYFKQVVGFTEKKGVKHYKVKVWNKEGTFQSVIESAKLTEQETPEEIAKRVSQIFRRGI